MHTRQCWFGYFLGPNPNYSVYDRILATARELGKRTRVDLRLLTSSEGFPAALYLCSSSTGDCELLMIANWLPCSLPTPREHFPLTVL
jgi:hypothetical protein